MGIAAEKQRRALELAEELIGLDTDNGTTFYARKIREHLRLPMSTVLDRLWPSATVTEKVERLGVTRQAYYGWISGSYRPDAKLSHKLAQITGYSEEDIRGRLPARR